MHKAIFLDRDGTLNIDPGFVHKVEDFRLYDKVIEGLSLFKGYKLFIISNQSGIGRGFFTADDVEKFNNRMLTEFREHDIFIEKIYICPHAPETNCECRKPGLQFINDAVKDYQLNLDNSWVIGDRVSDILLAKNAGMRSVYMLTGFGNKYLKEAKQTEPDFIAADFLEAALFIRLSG